MSEPGESLVSEHQFGFLFPLAVLGRKPRAPYVPGKCPTTESYSQPFPVLLWDGVLLGVGQAGPSCPEYPSHHLWLGANGYGAHCTPSEAWSGGPRPGLGVEFAEGHCSLAGPGMDEHPPPPAPQEWMDTDLLLPPCLLFQLHLSNKPVCFSVHFQRGSCVL